MGKKSGGGEGGGVIFMGFSLLFYVKSQLCVASNQSATFSLLLAMPAFLRKREENVLCEGGVLPWGQGWM